MDQQEHKQEQPTNQLHDMFLTVSASDNRQAGSLKLLTDCPHATTNEP